MDPAPSVLIVDDEPPVRDVMARWVSALGMTPMLAASAEEALTAIAGCSCELAFVDVVMPGRDGLWLTNELRQSHPDTAVVLATAYSSLLQADSDITGQIADLLVKPFARERFALAIDRGRRWRKQAIEEVRWQGILSCELRDRIDTICDELKKTRGQDVDELKLLTAIAHERIPDTMAHAGRVARYAASMVRELQLERTGRGLLERAALLHDIGKLAIPASLLSKPSPLSPIEQGIMRLHVSAGAEILLATGSQQDAAPIVLASHEWFGGGGYPTGCDADRIPLAARVIAVADAYDAMTQERSYRPTMNSSEAIAELLRCSGTQFDPNAVAAMLAVLGTH